MVVLIQRSKGLILFHLKVPQTFNMNQICKTIHQDTLQQFLVISCHALKSSKIVPKKLTTQKQMRYCSGCVRDIAAEEEVLNQERRVHHFASSVTRWVLLGRPISSHVGVLEKVHSASGQHSLSDNTSALGLIFSMSRNYSTTSRICSSTTVASSLASSSSSLASSAVPSATEASSLAVLPAEASTVLVDSSSSSGLLFPDFFPIYGAEKTIEYIHQLTGLPWWSTIILTAFILRVVVMIPLTLHSFYNMAKLQNLQQEVKEKAESLKKEVALAMRQFKWTEKRAKEEYRKNMKRIVTDLYIRDNCHPMKGVAVFWVQMPVWISVSYALRNMSLRALNPNLDGHVDLKNLSEQGLAWFPDLTATDGTWLLPVIMGTVVLFNIEMTNLNIPEVTRYRKWLTYGLRGVGLLMIPISATLPSSMVLYWISSGTFGAAQNLLFEYSPFRRLVNLPKSKTESHSPLGSLAQKAKARYWKKQQTDV